MGVFTQLESLTMTDECAVAE
jgi:hypothetical protein